MRKQKTERNKLKNPKGKNFNKGITLIALIITLIVLLILAGVSIATLAGDNGVLTKASKAKEKTIVAEAEEKIKLAYMAAKIDKLANDDSTDVTYDELAEHLKEPGMTVEEGNYPIQIKDNNSGRAYDVYGEDTIIEVPNKDMSPIFEVDTATGYITGIKDEYLESPAVSNYTNTKIASLKDTKVALIAPKSYLKEEVGNYLVIPEKIDGTTITGIAFGAFQYVMNLEYVKLPNTITVINTASFAGAHRLKGINIPNSVVWIGECAFEEAGLISIEIPESVTSIGNDAFVECSSLTSIKIDKPTGTITGSPWGASSSDIVHWNDGETE